MSVRKKSLATIDLTRPLSNWNAQKGPQKLREGPWSSEETEPSAGLSMPSMPGREPPAQPRHRPHALSARL